MNVYRSYNGLFKLFEYTHNVSAICRNILGKIGFCFVELGGIFREIWHLPARIHEAVRPKLLCAVCTPHS